MDLVTLFAELTNDSLNDWKDLCKKNNDTVGAILSRQLEISISTNRDMLEDANELLGIRNATEFAQWYADKTTPLVMSIQQAVEQQCSFAMDRQLALLKDNIAFQRTLFERWQTMANSAIEISSEQLDKLNAQANSYYEELTSKLSLDEFVAQFERITERESLDAGEPANTTRSTRRAA